MDESQPVEQVPPSRSVMRGLARWAIKQTVFVLILAAALFLPAAVNLPARGAAGARAWLYLILVAAIQVLTALVLMPRSPELLVERSQLKEGAKSWDILLAVLMGYSTVFMALAVGLESRRNPLPGIDAATWGAALVAIAGTLFTLWAMMSNPFFSGIVRIQKERGHRVASAGPYRYVRHPGYVGMLVFTLASPLILGSWWAGAVAVVTLAVTVVRTALEDRTLQTELEGYAEYAQRVRYRLLPGLW